MILNILLTLFLVSLNGFFVAAEFAIVKVRLSQIELRVRTGSKFAKLAKHLILHLDAYLSATQLGITLASLGLGWIGEPIVAVIIIDVMNFFGFTLTEQLAHSIALPVAFAIITVLHIVFGELAPKSLAIQRSEQVALIVALPLRFFYIIFSPFIWILNNLANFFLKLIGFEPVTETEGLHSADELRYLLEESSKSGVIGVSEQKLLDNVFDLPNTPIKHIMVPRGRIFGVDFSMSSNEILEKFINEGYSRMPIYDKTIDNIIGVIYAKDVISILRYPNLIIVKDIIRPAFFVHEEEKINKLLHDMQRNKVHLAIVLDDFGGTAGLVTLEDIIERSEERRVGKECTSRWSPYHEKKKKEKKMKKRHNTQKREQALGTENERRDLRSALLVNSTLYLCWLCTETQSNTTMDHR